MPALGRVVELDVQVRDPLDAQRLAELVPDERHRVPERGHARLALGRLADDADPDLGVAQVRRRLDRRDRREPDPRIRDVTRHDRPDLLPQELVDPIGSLAHRCLRSHRPQGAARAYRQRAEVSCAAPADGLRGEALDDVAFHEVVEVGQADAALVVLLDLADVVAEAAQRLDPVGRDDLAAAPDPGAAADDPAVGDERAGDDRVLADPDDLADLGATLDDLDDLRLEQALEGRLDVVGELVDDVVQADVDALGLGRPAGGVGDLGVEADDDRVRGGRQHDVVVGDVAGALVQDVEPDLVLVELLERVGDRAERARHVGLEDDPELLGLAGLDLAVEVLEGGATAALPALGGGRGLARLDHRAGFLLVARRRAGCRRPAGTSDRPRMTTARRRAGLGDALARVVLERADAAERLADDDDVADLERAGLDEGGRDRAAALVELGLDDRADGGRASGWP